METAGNILHINITDFMAAVEEVRDCSLRGRPFVLGWEGRSRAVVLAVSEAAFQEGLRKGMPISLAKKKVRGLRVLPPAHDVYRRADERLAEVARHFSPRVEVRGGGHLYVDLSGTHRLFGPSTDCAQRIRREIVQATELLPALGLASARVVSKVGTRVVRPWGFITIPPGEEQGFLAPLDVALLPGVGTRLLTRLRMLQIHTIGELSSLTEEEAAVLGPLGLSLLQRARGIDSPLHPGSLRGRERDARLSRGGGVRQGSEEKPFSLAINLPEDANDPYLMRYGVSAIFRTLGFTLRQEGLLAGKLRLQVTYTDGLQQEGTKRFSTPTNSEFELTAAAQTLLPLVLRRRVRVRVLKGELDSLCKDPKQLSLEGLSMPRASGSFSPYRKYPDPSPSVRPAGEGSSLKIEGDRSWLVSCALSDEKGGSIKIEERCAASAFRLRPAGDTNSAENGYAFATDSRSELPVCCYGLESPEAEVDGRFPCEVKESARLDGQAGLVRIESVWPNLALRQREVIYRRPPADLIPANMGLASTATVSRDKEAAFQSSLDHIRRRYGLRGIVPCTDLLWSLPS